MRSIFAHGAFVGGMVCVDAEKWFWRAMFAEGDLTKMLGTSHRPHPLSAGHWASGTHFSLGVAKLKQENIVMILISICYHLVVMRPRDTEISNENIFPVMI